MQGAVASVLFGAVLSVIFVTDQLVGVGPGSKLFPWLHHKLTLKYTYRGLWGTIGVALVLLIVSACTPRPDAKRLEKLTVNWSSLPDRFRGLADWRLQWAVLSLTTIGIYYLLW
jgi:SSS family solute:Na+ symporter